MFHVTMWKTKISREEIYPLHDRTITRIEINCYLLMMPAIETLHTTMKSIIIKALVLASLRYSLRLILRWTTWNMFSIVNNVFPGFGETPLCLLIFNIN